MKLSDILPPHPLYGRLSYVSFYDANALSREQQKIVVKMAQGVYDWALKLGHTHMQNDVVESIFGQFNEDGYISKKQLQVLIKFLEKLMTVGDPIRSSIVYSVLEYLDELPPGWANYIESVLIEGGRYV